MSRLLRALLLRGGRRHRHGHARSRSSRSRRSRGSARRAGLILAVQELGLARHQARRLGGAARGVAAAARLGRGAGRVRADGGRVRLGLGRDARRRRAATATAGCSTGRSGSSRTPAWPGCTPCSRRPTPDAGHDGISAFIVEADTPGFEVARLEEKLGICGSTTGELVFDGCRVPGEATCSATRARASGSRCGSSTARAPASRRRRSGSRRARPTTRSSTPARGRRWAGRSRSTS